MRPQDVVFVARRRDEQRQPTAERETAEGVGGVTTLPFVVALVAGGGSVWVWSIRGG